MLRRSRRRAVQPLPAWHLGCGWQRRQPQHVHGLPHWQLHGGNRLQVQRQLHRWGCPTVQPRGEGLIIRCAPPKSMTITTPFAHAQSKSAPLARAAPAAKHVTGAPGPLLGHLPAPTPAAPPAQAARPPAARALLPTLPAQVRARGPRTTRPKGHIHAETPRAAGTRVPAQTRSRRHRSKRRSRHLPGWARRRAVQPLPPRHVGSGGQRHRPQHVPPLLSGPLHSGARSGVQRRMLR